MTSLLIFCSHVKMGCDVVQKRPIRAVFSVCVLTKPLKHKHTFITSMIITQMSFLLCKLRDLSYSIDYMSTSTVGLSCPCWMFNIHEG